MRSLRTTLKTYAFTPRRYSMRHMRRCGVLATLGAVLLGLAGMLRADDDKVECQIIYVPTEVEVVEKMLDMAKVTKDDIVYDLGCGDGRVVAIAAKNFGARGVGVDIDPERIKDSHQTVKKYGVEK